MALSWLAVLKTVPWTDVLSAAPQVAGSARSLWDAVANRSSAKLASVPEVESAQSHIATRVDQIETDLAALEAQMVSASEIIRSLADQNTLMTAKIEQLRKHQAWLSATIAVVLILVVGSLVAVIK